jgi:cysteine sulfinate desulfinase/cysteine desulfurase-like protein
MYCEPWDFHRNVSASSALRFSLGASSTWAEVDQAVERIVKVVRRLRDSPTVV